MQARKGFIHVVEIILISLVAFLIIYQFSTIPPITSAFEQARLSLLGTDILFTLSAKDVNWLDGSQVRSEIDALLANTSILYSVDVRNAIPSPIIVGCLCDSSPANDQLSLVRDMLQSFRFNGEQVNFSVLQLQPPSTASSPVNPLFDSPTLPLTYDVVVVFDDDLASAGPGPAYDYTPELVAYLKAGKGIIQVRDLDATDLDLLTPQGKIERDFFGMVASLATPAAGGIDVADPATPDAQRITDFLFRLPVYYEDFEDGQAQGWTATAGFWAVSGGAYVQSAPGQGRAHYTGLALDDLILSALITSPDGEGNQSLVWRADGGSTYAAFGSRDIDHPGFPEEVAWTAVSGGTVNEVVASPATAFGIDLQEAAANRYRVVVSGDQHQLFADGRLVANTTNATVSSPGFVGLDLSGSSRAEEVAVALGGPVAFANFLDPVEKVNTTSTPLLVQQGTGVPAAAFQHTLLYGTQYLPGRTAWVSGGAEATLEGQALIRALVVWAAGDRYAAVPATVPDPTTSSLFIAVNDDLYQPLEILLSLDSIF